MKRNFLVKDVKPYSMKELCEIYQVSDKTMRKWLEPFSDQIGKRQGHIYNVAQIVTIFTNLGVPSILE
jgi:NADH/NAD ratio-sensing transcriptional regulator Rex